MKKIILSSMLVLSSVFIASCSGENESTENATSEQGKEVYTCPMHPEVTSDKPGDCPKCGMALEKK